MAMLTSLIDSSYNVYMHRDIHETFTLCSIDTDNDCLPITN